MCILIIFNNCWVNLYFVYFSFDKKTFTLESSSWSSDVFTLSLSSKIKLSLSEISTELVWRFLWLVCIRSPAITSAPRSWWISSSFSFSLWVFCSNSTNNFWSSLEFLSLSSWRVFISSLVIVLLIFSSKFSFSRISMLLFWTFFYIICIFNEALFSRF